MPVLSDEDVGLSPSYLSDEDVGLVEDEFAGGETQSPEELARDEKLADEFAAQKQERKKGGFAANAATALGALGEVVEPFAVTPQNPLGAFGTVAKGLGHVAGYTGQVGKGVVQDLRLGNITGLPATSQALSTGRAPNLEPTSLPARIIEGAGQGIGSMVPAIAATAVGVPPMAAYPTVMGSQAYQETGGDLKATAQAALLGAVLPAVSSVAKAAAGRAIVGATRYAPTLASNPVLSKTVEEGASQIAQNAVAGIVEAPELMALYKEDPNKFYDRAAEMIGVNLAMGAHDIMRIADPSVRSQSAQELAKLIRPQMPEMFTTDQLGKNIPEPTTLKAMDRYLQDRPEPVTLREMSKTLKEGAPPAPRFTPPERGGIPEPVRPTQGEPNAIQIGKAAKVPVGETPAVGQEVGARTEAQAQPQKGDAAQEQARVLLTDATPGTSKWTKATEFLKTPEGQAAAESRPTDWSQFYRVDEAGNRSIDPQRLTEGLKSGKIVASPEASALLSHLLETSDLHPLESITPLEFTPDQAGLITGEQSGFAGRQRVKEGGRESLIDLVMKHDNGEPVSQADFVHVATHELLHNNLSSKFKDAPELQAQTERLLELARAAAKGTPMEGHYGLSRASDLLSEMSDPAFKKWLNSVKDGDRSVYQKIIDVFKKLFRLPDKMRDAFGREVDSGSALESLIGVASKLDKTRRTATPKSEAEFSRGKEDANKLPPVPEGHVRLFHGEGGPQGGGKGGSFYTESFTKASTFGPDVSWVDVPADKAQAAKEAARKSGQGGDTALLTKEDAAKAKSIAGKSETKVHDLDEPAGDFKDEIKNVEKVSNEELVKQGGSVTQFMWKLGAKAKTPEDVAALKSMAEESNAKVSSLAKEGKIEEAMAIAGRQPAEAYEFATGVKLDGTPKWEMFEKQQPGYKPAVPDAKYLAAKSETAKVAPVAASGTPVPGLGAGAATTPLGASEPLKVTTPQQPSPKPDQIPAPERFDTVEDVLKFRTQRHAEEAQLYEREIGLSPEKAKRLQELMLRQASTVRFEAKLSPTEQAAFNKFFDESPYNKVGHPFEFWEGDSRLNPEEVAQDTSKESLAEVLVTAAERGIEANPNSDRFLSAVIAARRLKELGGTQSDIARYADRFSTRESSSQGDKAFFFQRLAKRTGDFLKSQGIELPEGELHKGPKAIPKDSGATEGQIPTVEGAKSQKMWSSADPSSGGVTYYSDRKADADAYALGRPSRQHEVKTEKPFDPQSSSDKELVKMFDELGGIHEAPQNPAFVEALKAKGFDSIIGGEKGYRGESNWIVTLPKTKSQKWTGATEEAPKTDARGETLGGQTYAGFPNPAAVVAGIRQAVKDFGPGVKAAGKVVSDATKAIYKENLSIRKMNDLDRSVLGWSKKLQQSFYEASKAQKDVQAVAKDKVRDDALSNWMEAGGDKAKITAWRDGTTDPKAKAGYEAALNLSPEEVAMAQDARRAYDQLWSRAERWGLVDKDPTKPSSFRDDYVTHLWNLGKGAFAGGARTLKDQFKFAKARTFENYFEGEQAGMKPKTKRLSQLLPVYLHEMNSVIAARQLVKQMGDGVASDGRPLLAVRGRAESVSGVKGEAVLVRPKAPIGDTKDYKALENQPALHDWTWIGKDTAGKPIFEKSDLVLHPEAYKKLNAILGKSKIREWYDSPGGATMAIPKALAKGLDMFQSETKRTMLGLISPFHQVQEGTHAIGHRINPFFNVPKPNLENPVHQNLAKKGLMILPDRASERNFTEGLRPSGLVSFIPGVGKVADYYSNYLFHEYIPGLKIKTALAIIERNKKVYEKELASGEVSLEDVELLSTTQTNAAYGHLNYADLGRSPTIQHILQLGLLAPDFLEARGRFAGQALKGVGPKVGREQLLALATLAVAQAAGAWTMAQLTDGEWEGSHPFEFRKNNRRYTMRSVPEDLMRFGEDIKNIFTGRGGDIPFISNRVNPITAKLPYELTFGREMGGRKITRAEALKKGALAPAPLTARGFMGIDKSPLSEWEQLAGAVGAKIMRYSPQNEVGKMFRDWKSKSENPRLVAQAEQDEAQTFAPSIYSDLRQALEKDDWQAGSEAYNKLMETKTPAEVKRAMNPMSVDPSTGASRDRLLPKKLEREFLGSLSDEDREVYEDAKRQRRLMYQRFQRLLKGD